MQEFLKSVKLINELAAFVFKAGGKEFDINFKENDLKTKITIESDVESLSKKAIDTLKGLNTPRQSEVEEYYWELAGENDNYQELFLVGMMIDYAEYSYIDNHLKIIVIKNK